MTKMLLFSAFGAILKFIRVLSCHDPLDLCHETLRPKQLEVFAFFSTSDMRRLFALRLLISMALNLELVAH